MDRCLSRPALNRALHLVQSTLWSGPAICGTSSGNKRLPHSALSSSLSGSTHVSTRRWMSARPVDQKAGPEQCRRKKMTITQLSSMRTSGKPITMLTAYDYPTALRCEAAGIDITLVGDSLAQVALGYDSTTRLTLDEMIHHSKAVSRGTKSAFLVVDMPFGTCATGVRDAIANAIRLVREGGAEAVKMEGGEEVVDVVREMSRMGIPVMGHIGLMPQRHTMSSGYRVQGKSADAAISLLRMAHALQDAGAFSIVLEAMPHKLAAHITDTLSIPTIGIGAGPHTSGQVLVHDDALGIWGYANGEGQHAPKFVRRFGELGRVGYEGAKSYANAVRGGSFPSVEKGEAYEMDHEVWKMITKRFKEMGMPLKESRFYVQEEVDAGIRSPSSRDVPSLSEELEQRTGASVSSSKSSPASPVPHTTSPPFHDISTPSHHIPIPPPSPSVANMGLSPSVQRSLPAQRHRTMAN